MSPARRRDAASDLSAVEHGKCNKHASVCRSHGIDFVPIRFSVLGSFSTGACSCWDAHTWICRRLSFAIVSGVAKQFVGSMSNSFRWCLLPASMFVVCLCLVHGHDLHALFIGTLIVK